MTLAVGIPWQHAETDAGYYSRVWKQLGEPDWYTWKADCIGRPGFTPMAWKPKPGPAFTKVLQAAQRGPRQLWFLGNEPERAEQSDTSGAMRAEPG